MIDKYVVFYWTELMQDASRKDKYRFGKVLSEILIKGDTCFFILELIPNPNLFKVDPKTDRYPELKFIKTSNVFTEDPNSVFKVFETDTELSDFMGTLRIF